MEDIIIYLINTLKQLSYLGIVIALSIEFIPAEIILPLAGYWVYQGDLHFYLTILAGSAGGTLGPLTLYALGRYGGRPLLLKVGKYVWISEKQIHAADRFFERYGAGVAFFARFIPGVRTTISIPCGIAKMNVWKFTIYTFMATLPITAFYVYLGYRLGPHWSNVDDLIKAYGKPMVLITIALLLIYFIIKKWKNRNEIVVIKKL